jgi:hypothetical protein
VDWNRCYDGRVRRYRTVEPLVTAMSTPVSPSLSATTVHRKLAPGPSSIAFATDGIFHSPRVAPLSFYLISRCGALSIQLVSCALFDTTFLLQNINIPLGFPCYSTRRKVQIPLSFLAYGSLFVLRAAFGFFWTTPLRCDCVLGVGVC